MKYTIGLDFGSLSARAVMLCAEDGKTVGSEVYNYPHGILDKVIPGGRPVPEGWALQVPEDYRQALAVLIPSLLAHTGVGAGDVIGVGIDATSCTIVPAAADGRVMCEVEGFENEPHAYIKMWKHHGAQTQADRLLAEAVKSHVPWLEQFGGFISAEHFLPKAAQIAQEAPNVYAKCCRLWELGDWLVWLLTGSDCRNYCAAGFKTYCSREGRDIDPDFLAGVDLNLRDLHDKYSRHIVHPGDAAGRITPEAARLTGLLPGTPVSAAMIDAHATSLGCRTADSGDVLLIIGTSTCVIALSDEYAEVRGLNGVVPDGILKNKNAYEGGQSAVGDMFAWFCENCVPASYTAESESRGIGIQQLLTEKAAALRPGESGLVALDWVNGVRSPLMDFDLSGLICGMTLNTKAEHLYRALIEATAFGAYAIVDELRKKNVPVKRIYASGGIPLKNPMLSQIYADVFDMEITVVDEPYSACVGSAVLGLSAADGMGGADYLGEIINSFPKNNTITYRPDKQNAEIYRKLRSIYSRLSEEYGHRSKIMKDLKALRQI